MVVFILVELVWSSEECDFLDFEGDQLKFRCNAHTGFFAVLTAATAVSASLVLR